MRYTHDGFFDKLAKHGEISGSGPGWESAASAFRHRTRRLQLRGVWRKAPASWKTNDGTYIDPDYYIVDHGQDG